MLRWGQITVEFRDALNTGDYEKMHRLINENFDLRRKIVRISQGNIEMVELARSTGASAKFTGSGGAVIGTYRDENMFDKLRETLSNKGIEVFKPNIVNH
jgi:glucuronokinase